MSETHRLRLHNYSREVILCAGVFGLLTALHLSKRGYTNIHIFDKEPYDENNYANAEGADAASADENMVLELPTVMRNSTRT